jgi:glycosyltransferase involved in cell wall biosynthesis
VFERSAQFDIIHNSFDFLPLSYSGLVDTPVVTTLHGFSSERIVQVYQRYNSIGSYVAISAADRHPLLDYAATIHHGIDTSAFELCDQPGEALLFFGRIHPDKGTAAAIEVARRAGRPLILAGIVQDESYFRTEVLPHIDGESVSFLGPIGGAQRTKVLRQAYALLHLIDFDEPFCFSVVEAMASGTPVVAFDRGSMKELIDDGVTGYVVQDIQAAVTAVNNVKALDRAVIRAIAIRRFDSDRMVDQYVALYRNILGKVSTRSHLGTPIPAVSALATR